MLEIIIADVAQLVEQDFRKVKVGGSIPLIGLIYGFVYRKANHCFVNLWFWLLKPGRSSLIYVQIP